MAAAAAVTEKEAMVDPFLVEALQNPRHRLTSKSILSQTHDPISLFAQSLAF